MTAVGNDKGGASRPQIMGIVNVTPDSFSGDGVLMRGDYVAEAVRQAEAMVADGADILDIGGESSRPGSQPVSVDEELRRVVPVVAAIRQRLASTPIAVDTTKAEVAAQSLQAGASMINDITALAADANMGAVVARAGAAIVLMHNRAAAQSVTRSGNIGGSYDAAAYGDVVADVLADLTESVQSAEAAGISRHRIILDPGIGFGKSPQQNMALIAHLDRLKTLGFPVLMGVSRKSFIGHILGTPVDERLEGTAACIAACVWRGADILRVHDVKFMARVAQMTAALRDA